MSEETTIEKALRHAGIELSILLGLDESPIPSDVREGMRKTLALIDEAAPAAAVAEEHYQAAIAMNEKHRKLLVAACQERDQLKNLLEAVREDNQRLRVTIDAAKAERLHQ
jgi:hypothetical protein